jgi:WD40 repeat protein
LLWADCLGTEAEGTEAARSRDPGDVSAVNTLDGQAPPAAQERAVPAIEGYEILGELGRGGMGVVYRARQVRLNRPCALKMILAGAHADAAAAVRFLAEAEAVARLQHSNVVQIHHVGEADGLPFFELEYVECGSLDRRLDGTPWPPRRAAELIEALARGIAEAHRLGIIHRDLKPGNILLAADGTPKVTDFGLAKSLASESGLTHTGLIMGSPGYMAPEQAEGKAKQVGPLADVYALGAILYELLTGRPPFRGTTLLETLEQVRTTEPVPPSRLVPGLPRDLETATLKCLQKESQKRYESAAALAEDLRRFRGGEPIVARPVPPWERAIKWARRRKAIATLVVAVLSLIAVLASLGIWSYVKINRGLTIAKEERRRALEQTKVANQRAEDLAWEDYVNRVNRAYAEVDKDNVALAEDLLHGCPTERRGWEWHYVKRLCHSERLSLEASSPSISAIAFSPDGRLLATGSGGPFFGGDGRPNVELWDRDTGRRKQILAGTVNAIWSLGYSPDGTKLALGGSRPQIKVLDVKSGEVLWTKDEAQLPQAMCVSFSPNGRMLAAGFGQYSQDAAFPVRLYEVATGAETGAFQAPNGGANDVAFHPGGRHLAVAGLQDVAVWDVVEGRKVRELPGHTKWVYSVAYSPDGKWLATGGWDRTIKLRDAASGQEQMTIFGHQGFVLDLAFGPDSRCLASTGEDRSVQLWQVPTGRRLGAFHGHPEFVQAVAFAPDGRELASGGLEGTVKVWDRRTSLPVVFEEHTGWVGRLWYRRDGRRVVSAAVGHHDPADTTKGWDPSTGEADPTLTGIDPDAHGDEYLSLSSHRFGDLSQSTTSPDGKLVARIIRVSTAFRAGGRSREYANSMVEVLDSKTGRQVQLLSGHSLDVIRVAFSPDSRRLATASFDRTVKLWDTATGREVFTLRGHTAGVVAVAFSPDGQRLVSGGIDASARIWDATPLPEEMLRSQDARYLAKTRAFKERGRGTGEALRAENMARSGDWRLAAAAFGKALELEPNNFGLRYQQILALLEAGDRPAVQKACEAFLRRLPKAADPGTVLWAASSCVLAPDAVADHEAPIRLAESVIRSFNDRLIHVHGAALYRAGRFEEAIRSLEDGIRLRGTAGSPQDCVFLAMAHERLGHRDEAKRWLDRLAASGPKPGSDFSWDDVEIRILRHEAESLILGGSPAAPGTAGSASTKKASFVPKPG